MHGLTVLAATLSLIATGPDSLLSRHSGDAPSRIHAVIVGDTSPWAQWGRLQSNIEMDTTSVFASLFNNVPERRFVFYPLSLSENRDSRPDSILQAIQEQECTKNDVLFVYFSGHGGHDDRGPYLELAGGKLYRDRLRNVMEKKGARLNVLITDCCNSRSDGELFFTPAPELIEPIKVSPLFKSLFFSQTGWVDVTSSAPGQASFFVPFQDQEGLLPGSLFTTSLTEWIQRHRNESLGWPRLMRDVAMKTEIQFRNFYPNGARVAKGTPVQSEQTVFPMAYPGMPEREGPRTGLTVRDANGGGALIVHVEPDSPGTEVYDLAAGKFRSLSTGQAVIEMRGTRIDGATQFASLVGEAPQIVRLKVRSADGRQVTEYLFRMKY